MAVQSAALSGDGRTAIASTLDGVTRYDLVTVGDQLLVPGPTNFSRVLQVVAPGMWVRQTGTGLSRAGILLNGTPVQPLSRSATDVVWVVPAETPLGSASVESGQTDSPFGPAHQNVNVQIAAPTFILRGDLGEKDPTTSDWPVIWHEDTGRPVSAVDPARPGEVIEVLMTGLNGQGRSVEWLIYRLGVDEFWRPAFMSSAPYPGNTHMSVIRLKMPDTLPVALCALSAVFEKASSSVLMATPFRP